MRYLQPVESADTKICFIHMRLFLTLDAPVFGNELPQEESQFEMRLL